MGREGERGLAAAGGQELLWRGPAPSERAAFPPAGPGAGESGCGWLPEPISRGSGPSPLPPPAPTGVGSGGVGVTERDCPKPLLPGRGNAIKGPLRPAPDTPSAGSHPSERRAGLHSTRGPVTPARQPASHRECHDPLAWRERRECGHL